MPKVRKGDVVWVEPELVAEVRFAEWTHDGRLRAPVYQGLREDKEADEVQRERPSIEPEIKRGKRVLKLSNLDKPFWPEEGITKGDLLAYYRDVAPAIVPHLKDRPVHDEALSGRVEREVLLPEGRAEAHARLDPDTSLRGLDTRQAAAAPRDRLPAGERRARAALDGEHGLHRHEHLVLAGRQAVATRLGAVRPRPVSGRRLPRDDPGRAPDQGDARPARARVVSRRRAARRASTSSSRSPGGTPTPRRGSSRRSSPARSRALIPALRRPSGRRRSAAASSSTRIRTGRGRRLRRFIR